MFPPEFQSESTVRTFLNGFLGDIGGNGSGLEMAAKAAILFHRSAHVSGQWKPSEQFEIPLDVHVADKAPSQTSNRANVQHMMPQQGP